MHFGRFVCEIEASLRRRVWFFGEKHIARSLWETTTFLVGDYEIRLFGTLLDSFVKMLSHFFGGFKLSEK